MAKHVKAELLLTPTELVTFDRLPLLIYVLRGVPYKGTVLVHEYSSEFLRTFDNIHLQISL
jgi:hypothetical protein